MATKPKMTTIDKDKAIQLDCLAKICKATDLPIPLDKKAIIVGSCSAILCSIDCKDPHGIFGRIIDGKSVMVSYIPSVFRKKDINISVVDNTIRFNEFGINFIETEYVSRPYADGIADPKSDRYEKLCKLDRMEYTCENTPYAEYHFDDVSTLSSYLSALIKYNDKSRAIKVISKDNTLVMKSYECAMPMDYTPDVSDKRHRQPDMETAMQSGLFLSATKILPKHTPFTLRFYGEKPVQFEWKLGKVVFKVTVAPVVIND